MKFKLIQIAALSLFILSSIVMAADAPPVKKKMLLVGISGVQAEVLLQLETPEMDRLNLGLGKAYTGGLAGEGSEQLTKSGPGWATVLTGVWANKHKVIDNNSGLADSDFPSIFSRMHHANPGAYIASFVSWSPIHDQFFANDLDIMNSKSAGGSDQSNTDLAVDAIKNKDADLVFVELEQPDRIADRDCFGVSYNESIQAADAQLGQLLDEVDKKQAGGEDWLVLVTTDHGRTPGKGCSSGNQSEQEKTIFIASNKSLNSEFTEAIDDLPNESFDGIYGYPAQTAILPTIMDHMSIPNVVDYRLDSTSLLYTPSVRKLMAEQRGIFGWKCGISWYGGGSSDSDEISIYRNGTLVDTVNATTGFWQDSDPATGINDYVFELGLVPVGYRIDNQSK